MNSSPSTKRTSVSTQISPEFNIFHLTDSHWILGKPTGNDQFRESIPGLIRLFRDEVIQGAGESAKADSTINVLALGGDFVNGGRFFSSRTKANASAKVDEEPTFAKTFENGKLIKNPEFNSESPFIVFINELIVPILQQKRSKRRSLFDAVIAVPGNHDVDRTAPENVKFWKFECAIQELRKTLAKIEIDIPVITPLSANPLQVFPVGNHEFKRHITIWAANTSHKCGEVVASGRDIAKILKESERITRAAVEGLKDASEVETHKRHLDVLSHAIVQAEEIDDPGFINPETLKETEALLRDTPADALRIAIAHHNVLPLRNDDYKKANFWNAGLFTRFLLDNRFRIYCHGHQHITSISAYNRTSADSDGFQSYLTNTLLHVGGPAYDVLKGQNVSHRGFTIIRGRFSPEHDICEVKVVQNVIDAEERFREASKEYDIAISVGDHKSDKADHKKKLKDVIQDANRIIYSNKSLAGLIRAFDDEQKYDQNHASSLRAVFRRLRDIRAVYAVSVFSPTDWLHRKLMGVFMPFGRESIIRASSSHGSGRASERVLKFSFSTPLCFGVRTAVKNASDLGLLKFAESAIRERNRSKTKQVQAEDFLDEVRAKIQSGGVSSAMWDGVITSASIRGGAISASVEIEDLGLRPHHNFSPVRDNHYPDNAKLFEFPRIVLWSREQLLKPSALDIIQYHEQMGFPLFWLDVDSIVSKAGVPRSRVGYVSIIGLQPEAVGFQYAEEKCHLADGTPVEDSLFVEAAWKNGEPSAWIDDPEKHLKTNNVLTGSFKPLHEFIFLLGRPDLVFASDAWIFAHGGMDAWNQFIDFIRK